MLHKNTRRRAWTSLLGCAATVASAAVITTPLPSQAAVSGQVLILGSTVSDGTSSVEATEVAALGLTPVVVDATTWSSLSTADFASYRGIILGDATCGGDPSAAATNAPAWGAAVNGNVIINGTDPVYHDSQGGNALSRQSVDYAVDQVGKTGLYVSLSCYFHDTTAGTPVPLLDGISPGGFAVTGVGCYNNSHIVATHPVLLGLADATLSNWSCSVHEAFTAWPSDFTVLAIARDFAATYTASDGSVGTPYILARGGGLRSFPLSLDPRSQERNLRTSATVTAQLLDAATSAPVGGQLLKFRVAAGPNSGASGTCSPTSCATDSGGHVSWTYVGTKQGTDTVQTWIDRDADGSPSSGEPQTTSAVLWLAAATNASFVALGDSYSSGEGTYDYYPDSNAPLSFDMCHRSPHAYSVIAANGLGLGDPQFKACSGALTDDFFNGNTENLPEPKQLKWLGDDTKIVTFTIGGNDAGFVTVLKKCVNGPEAGKYGCSADKALRAEVQNRLNVLRGASKPITVPGRQIHSLLSTYRAVHAAAKNAKIYVGGYPRLFGTRPAGYDFGGKSGAACLVGATAYKVPLFYSVDYLDALWIDGLANKLNGAITDAVNAARAEGIDITYVPASFFAGHGLCDTAEPWLNDIVFGTNPLTGKPESESESFHPNRAGQAFGYASAFRIAIKKGL